MDQVPLQENDIVLLDPETKKPYRPFLYRKWTGNCRTLASTCSVAELHGFPTDENPFNSTYCAEERKAWRPQHVRGQARKIVTEAEKAMKATPYLGGWSGVMLAVLGPNQLLVREELLSLGFREVARYDNPVYTNHTACESRMVNPPGHICYMLIKYTTYSPLWMNGAEVTTEQAITDEPAPFNKK